MEPHLPMCVVVCGVGGWVWFKELRTLHAECHRPCNQQKQFLKKTPFYSFHPHKYVPTSTHSALHWRHQPLSPAASLQWPFSTPSTPSTWPSTPMSLPHVHSLPAGAPRVASSGWRTYAGPAQEGTRFNPYTSQLSQTDLQNVTFPQNG